MLTCFSPIQTVPPHPKRKRNKEIIIIIIQVIIVIIIIIIIIIIIVINKFIYLLAFCQLSIEFSCPKNLSCWKKCMDRGNVLANGSQS